MNEQLIQENKQKLEAEARRLREILGTEGKLDGKGEFPGEYKPKFPVIGDDEDENALEVDAFQTNLSVVKDMEMKLTKVEAALKRITDGTYGHCKFGDEVEEERLKVLPEADTCIKHSK